MEDHYADYERNSYNTVDIPTSSAFGESGMAIAEARSAIIGRRYQLLDPLGQGGMGIVFRAVDRLSGQHVALKHVMAPTEQLLFASQTGKADLRLALASEFQILATLRHPNIIGVLDYGFDEQLRPYFTMDLLEQPRTLMKAARDAALPIKIDLLVQMLQALTYVHRRGIVHRDLKPSNVLVGQDSKVKVLDFGLSLEVGQVQDSSGTLAYMAPEVMKGERASIAADLYAVGVMAYELLVGHHPFDTDNIS